MPKREWIAYLDSEQIVRGKAEISIFDQLVQYHYSVIHTYNALSMVISLGLCLSQPRYRWPARKKRRRFIIMICDTNGLPDRTSTCKLAFSSKNNAIDVSRA